MAAHFLAFLAAVFCKEVEGKRHTSAAILALPRPLLHDDLPTLGADFFAFLGPAALAFLGTDFLAFLGADFLAFLGLCREFMQRCILSMDLTPAGLTHRKKEEGHNVQTYIHTYLGLLSGALLSLLDSGALLLGC